MHVHIYIRFLQECYGQEQTIQEVAGLLILKKTFYHYILLGLVLLPCLSLLCTVVKNNLLFLSC